MGCFAKGCITLVILLMVLGLLVGGFGWYMFRNITAFISPTPVPIRTYPATAEQYQEVIARYTDFIKALNAGQAATLTLSADDLNTLIARDPEFKDVRGKMFMSIEKDELIAETSFPIPEDKRRFGSGGRSRGYFNGRARFAASYSGGELTVFVRKIESMDGKPMSDMMLSFINKADLTQWFNQSMRDERRKGTAWAEAMSKVQKVVIEDGHIVATAVEGTPATNPIPLPGQSPAPVCESERFGVGWQSWSKGSPVAFAAANTPHVRRSRKTKVRYPLTARRSVVEAANRRGRTQPARRVGRAGRYPRPDRG